MNGIRSETGLAARDSRYEHGKQLEKIGAVAFVLLVVIMSSLLVQAMFEGAVQYSMFTLIDVNSTGSLQDVQASGKLIHNATKAHIFSVITLIILSIVQFIAAFLMALRLRQGREMLGRAFDMV